MRSTLYDTVSDRYMRFLRDEILADVGARYNLRKDAYSHAINAITGSSSGGICSFNAAWQMPESMTWFCRDYDLAKSEQEFTADPAKKGKPYFRVKSLNREDD